jgi:chromosome segregation ATPase
MMARDVGMLLTRADEFEDQLDTAAEAIEVLRSERNDLEERCASLESASAALGAECAAAAGAAEDAAARAEAERARADQLERTVAALMQRLAAVESRVAAVETRVPEAGARDDEPRPAAEMNWFRRFLARRRARRAAGQQAPPQV